MTGAPSPYFLGVDGGGSKTLAVVVDAWGRERGRGMAGSSNQEAVGFVGALAELRAAVARAAAASRVTPPFAAAWCGLAGVDRPGDGDAFAREMHGAAAMVRVTNDAELALGALPRRVGVALIAGTGAIALGRDAHGNTTRASGWGHALGDEGSGYTLAQQALQAVLRAADGRGPATLLLERTLAHWELRAPEQIMGRVYQPFDKTAIAALAPVVLAAAHDGDQVARRIVARAADELALAALTVARGLDFAGGCVPLALGGGLLLHAVSLRARVLRRMARSIAVDPVLVAEPALTVARALARERNDEGKNDGQGARDAASGDGLRPARGRSREREGSR